MGGPRKNFSSSRNDFFQHDDRDGSQDSKYNRNNNSQNKFSGRGSQHYQSFGGYRRGGRRGGSNFYQSGPRRHYPPNDDVNMKNDKQSRIRQTSRGRIKRFRNSTRPIGGTGECNWHKLVMKGAALYTKEEVMAAIKEYVDEEFTPFMLEVEGSNIVFYLERNQSVARAIANLSGRITLGDKDKLIIYLNEMMPPLRKITPEQKEVIKAVMADRFAVELSRLDLKNFHNDKTLVRNQIFCPLYRRPSIECVLEVLMANCPTVEELDLSQNQIMFTTDWEPLKNLPGLKRLSLDRNRLKSMEGLKLLKGLQITELTLEGNVLCDQYNNNAEKYTSAVRGYFPKLERLDGVDLGKPIGFELDEVSLPPTRPSFFFSEEIKAIALQFIEQYFQVFESEDRKPLEAAYTEDAVFSLSCNFPDSGVGFKLARPYINVNRNLKVNSNPERRKSLLFIGRSEVIDVLNRLPKVSHDANSFVIDIPFAQPVLMHVVLTGIFKQTNMKNPLYRNFMKSMVIVPIGGGFCISNEQFYVNTAAVDQIQASLKNSKKPIATASTSSAVSPGPAPSADPLANLQPGQIEVIKQFSETSKMLPQYSRMCLERNDWDYAKAGEMFLGLQNENKIPPEYFGLSSP